MARGILPQVVEKRRELGLFELFRKLRQGELGVFFGHVASDVDQASVADGRFSAAFFSVSLRNGFFRRSLVREGGDRLPARLRWNRRSELLRLLRRRCPAPEVDELEPLEEHGEDGFPHKEPEPQIREAVEGQSEHHGVQGY